MTASAAFFVQFISLSNSAEAIREVLTQNGLSLVQYILQAIAGVAPRSYLGAFSDILGAMTSHCVTLLSQWLEVCSWQLNPGPCHNVCCSLAGSLPGLMHPFCCCLLFVVLFSLLFCFGVFYKLKTNTGEVSEG